jgi:hypothetical protein
MWGGCGRTPPYAARSVLVASNALDVQRCLARIASRSILQVTILTPADSVALLGIHIPGEKDCEWALPVLRRLGSGGARFSACDETVFLRSTGELGGEIQPRSPIMVELRRPPPPIPGHSPARKNYRK